MKWILVLGCLLFSNTITFTQTKIEDIYPIPIRLKITGEKMNKVYLMDINETSLTFFTDKKQLKANLLNQCKSCQTVALKEVEKMILPSTKTHAGKIIGGAIALMITGVAALNPRGDGLDAGRTAAIYGTYYGSIAFGLGAFLDGVSNNNDKQVFHEKKIKVIKNNVINFDVFPYLITHTPIAQFEKIQQQQRLDLQVMLLEIQVDPSMHLSRLSLFSAKEPVVSGYLIGSNEKYLFLSDYLFSVIDNRKHLPPTFKKVALSKILYYQID